MFLRFIHVTLCIRSLFLLLLNNFPSYGYAVFYLSISWWTCLFFLTVRNNSATSNMHNFWADACLQHLGVELLGWMVTLHLTFWVTARWSLTVAVSTHSQYFQFPHILPTVVCLFASLCDLVSFWNIHSKVDPRGFVDVVSVLDIFSLPFLILLCSALSHTWGSGLCALMPCMLPSILVSIGFSQWNQKEGGLWDEGLIFLAEVSGKGLSSCQAVPMAVLSSFHPFSSSCGNDCPLLLALAFCNIPCQSLNSVLTLSSPFVKLSSVFQGVYAASFLVGSCLIQVATSYSSLSPFHCSLLFVYWPKIAWCRVVFECQLFVSLQAYIKLGDYQKALVDCDWALKVREYFLSHKMALGLLKLSVLP
jgi:hypothetical protein